MSRLSDFKIKLFQIKQWYIKTSKLTPYDINSGLCGDFATTVKEAFNDVIIVGGPCHIFLMYKGLYYDAEEIDGVNDPRLLPIYKDKRLTEIKCNEWKNSHWNTEKWIPLKTNEGIVY